ncbi:DNA adenine methylase [Citrobacter sp. FP75]|uniref:DNA adenine methylase n=1 Tax=Citrobacter sp. FP75 TaxID=1852949 RepID=UPI001BCA1A51|nr:DNA adenine methylase [Citrobacter sp. FP75]
MIRSFLKWPGGKARVMPELAKHLPADYCLVEPFVGGATVFLNTNYPRYVLGDINPDLINTYRIAKNTPELLIDAAWNLFERHNSKADYISIRAEFNRLRSNIVLTLKSEVQRAAAFLYLNRHCFNGVVRYNLKGEFNTPYGHYKAPYFPEPEIRQFSEKANDTKTTFLCCSFESTIQANLVTGPVIYCDPPYLPASETSNFTEYYGGSFGADRHRQLAAALVNATDFGCRVILSNSDTPATRDIYRAFTMHEIAVNRSVSANGKRGKAGEVIAFRNASGMDCPPDGCHYCTSQKKCAALYSSARERAV